MIISEEDTAKKLSAKKVQLVDESDTEVGVTDVVTAHLGEGLLHRAVSVFLFREQSGVIELLMQRRSTEKLVGAEQWANTVCGNVEPGQTYLQCAENRLYYELGVRTSDLTDVYTLQYKVKCSNMYSEHEVDHIFTGWYSGVVTPNTDEVSEVRWMPWAEVFDALKQDNSFAPWFTVMSSDQILHQRIADWLKQGHTNR